MQLATLHWSGALVDADAGAPDAIVLLHGLGDTADVWRPMMESWRPRARVLAFDLPGHGRSPWLASDSYNVAVLAEHVSHALAEHKVRRPLLVAHSLGARVSIDLAARPELNAQGCILVDMALDANSEVGFAVAGHIDALRAGRATLKELVALVIDQLPLADEQAVATAVFAMAVQSGNLWQVPLDSAVKRLLGRSPREHVLEALAKVSGPASIVRGAYSAVLDRKEAAEMAAVLPCKPVPVHEVQMAGHAIPLEQPAALARAIDACLTEMPRAAAVH